MYSEKIFINIINLALKNIYRTQLNKIYSNENIYLNTINNFTKSFKKFNFFLKFLITNYVILTYFVNLFYIIIFFYKFKFNFFYEVNKILGKIVLVKNIQNFLIANLLLHTD